MASEKNKQEQGGSLSLILFIQKSNFIKINKKKKKLSVKQNRNCFFIP